MLNEFLFNAAIAHLKDKYAAYPSAVRILDCIREYNFQDLEKEDIGEAISLYGEAINLTNKFAGIVIELLEQSSKRDSVSDFVYKLALEFYYDVYSNDAATIEILNFIENNSYGAIKTIDPERVKTLHVDIIERYKRYFKLYYELVAKKMESVERISSEELAKGLLRTIKSADF